MFDQRFVLLDVTGKEDIVVALGNAAVKLVGPGRTAPSVTNTRAASTEHVAGPGSAIARKVGEACFVMKVSLLENFVNLYETCENILMDYIYN